MLNEETGHFFTQLSKFQRFYSKALTMRLTPYDVSPGYLSILNALWDKDGITQKALNAFIEVEQATLSNTLARMQRDQLIDRKPNPKDRRRVHIFLTDKGRSLQPAVISAIDDLQSHVNKGLTVNDRRYFNRVMKQMTEQLEEDLMDPCLMLFDEIQEDDA